MILTAKLICSWITRRYISIKPGFPECIDDFGFLWFEGEAVVEGVGKLGRGRQRCGRDH